ncbi:MAG: hypothetical protein EOS10_00080 [Mesorhizobium sp.]|uniref:hypothetical protein n=1 Tax=Mesorhizobium sp. TaxID=1871066 RepID=UPI000FEA8606|nr:hypothetical protein [Mesorhizobium sp.]RWO34737.1 MAG: hypothetical protein EOS10_00080 [Mesorhizobium sp.]
MNARPTIVVLGFKTTYEKNRETGKMDRPVDWVTYAPSHMAMYTQITDRVEWMRPDASRIKNDDEGKKIDFLRWRWEMIDKAYKAWKEGHEIPVDGTPLASWAGINSGQADVFRAMGLKSVEQIATMPDSIMGRVQLPGVRDIQKQAQAFLEASDRSSTANRLTELEGQNAALLERLEAAMALLDEQTKPKAKAKEAA